MALPISPRRRRTSLIPIAPRTSRSWLCQPATRLRMRAAPHPFSTAELDRARYALPAPLAQAALHGDQQRDVYSDRIGAANDELCHMLGHRHPAGADDRHEVPDAFIDEVEVDLFIRSLMNIPEASLPWKSATKWITSAPPSVSSAARSADVSPASALMATTRSGCFALRLAWRDGASGQSGISTRRRSARSASVSGPALSR